MMYHHSFVIPAIFAILNFAHACQQHADSAVSLHIDLGALTTHNNIEKEKCNSKFRPERKIAIRNVKVFDGYRILPESTVIIEGDKIGIDPAGAEEYDAQGGVLIPGLIDSHTHPSNISQLQALSRYGITTAFILTCLFPSLCLSLQGHSGLVDIKLATTAAYAPDSLHAQLLRSVDVNGTGIVRNSTEAKTWIEKQAFWGPDFVKIVAESPGLDQATINALVREARKKGKFAVVHASDLGSYEQAFFAKADQIHHAPLNRPINNSFAQLIRAQQQVVTPTLTMMKALSASDSKRNYTAAQQSVKTMHGQGIPILAGTDANVNIPGGFVDFGSSIHLEMELLVQAGLSPLDALRATTVIPAKHWCLDDRGVIKPGMRADLVLIEGNPLVNISATRNIKKVWLSGIEHA